MESKLRSGTTLIIDRYAFSGVAFSSAKGLDVEWCKVEILWILVLVVKTGIRILIGLDLFMLQVIYNSLVFAGSRGRVASSRSSCLPWHITRGILCLMLASSTAEYIFNFVRLCNLYNLFGVAINCFNPTFVLKNLLYLNLDSLWLSIVSVFLSDTWLSNCCEYPMPSWIISTLTDLSSKNISESCRKGRLWRREVWEAWVSKKSCWVIQDSLWCHMEGRVLRLFLLCQL